LNEKRYEVETCISAMRGIGEHRNVMAKHFLSGDWDYLLMIDADNPVPKNVLDLVELDKEVIGLPTPIQMSPIRGLTELFWNVFDENGYPTKETGEGLQEAHKVGTGAILIRRDVLEKIEHPFTTVRDADDLRIVSTDLAFCDKCRKKGIKIWTHWDYKCGHYKTIDLSTLFINY
jgi:GT2 family glycosyltransferase